MKDDQALQRQFAGTLRRLREDAGWSQEDFAMHAGVNRSYYGGLERGSHSPSLVVLVRIARALGVSLNELLAGIE